MCGRWGLQNSVQKVFKYNVTLHWRHQFWAFDSPNISSLWEFQSCTKQTCQEYWVDTLWNHFFGVPEIIHRSWIYILYGIYINNVYLCEILWNCSLPLFLSYYRLESFCFTCFAWSEMQTSFVPPQRLVRTPFLATVAASQQPGTLPGIRHEAKKGKLKSENTSLILWDFCSKHYFTLCCHHECTLWCWYLHLCLTARANLSQQPTGIALWKGPCWTLKDALPPPFQLIERHILSNSHCRQHNRTTSMASTAESCTHIWFLSQLWPEHKEHRVCINRSFTEASSWELTCTQLSNSAWKHVELITKCANPQLP